MCPCKMRCEGTASRQESEQRSAGIFLMTIGSVAFVPRTG